MQITLSEKATQRVDDYADHYGFHPDIVVEALVSFLPAPSETLALGFPLELKIEADRISTEEQL